MDKAEMSWVDAEDGYALALQGKKLRCKNPKGKQLRSVPAKVKKGNTAQQLLALRDWLQAHERECIDEVETWMLRSLPVPRAAVATAWDDPAWRKPLENAVVLAANDQGEVDEDTAGFLRGVDPKKGVGIVDLDGETQWLSTTTLAIPHPILLEDLNDCRELATELNLEQGISQLFRETWTKPADLDLEQTTIGDFSEGKFEQLNHALGKCRTLGYRVRGGFATCSVWEGGQVVEGRYWIGAEYPDAETYTGELLWVDARERPLALGAQL